MHLGAVGSNPTSSARFGASHAARSVDRVDRPELFEYSFELEHGTVELLAELTIERDVVLLDAVVVYPVGEEPFDVGPALVREGLRELARHFAGRGYLWLVVRGTRLTGAGPGHTFERAIPIPRSRENET